MQIESSTKQKRVLVFTVGLVLMFLAAQAMGDVGEAPTDLPSDYADTDPSAVEVFHDVLAPYGVWMEHPTYGLVWVPSDRVVGTEFVPYLTAGYWGNTEDGDWVWVSEYDWGWATFHYGRWVWIDRVGWAWIPGRQYAPAWVVWRVGDPGYDYIGWAPMPPSYYWHGGVAVSFWVIPPPYYVYCESRFVYSRHVHSHRLHGFHAHEAARHSRPHQPAAPSPSSDRHAARPTPGPTAGQARIPSETIPRTPTSLHPRVAADASAQRTRVGATRTDGRSTSTGVPQVGQPSYRGAPSASLPADRRAAPLASRTQLTQQQSHDTGYAPTSPSGGNRSATGATGSSSHPAGPASTPSRFDTSRSNGTPAGSFSSPHAQPSRQPTGPTAVPQPSRTSPHAAPSWSTTRPSHGVSGGSPSASSPASSSGSTRAYGGSSSTRPSQSSSSARPSSGGTSGGSQQRATGSSTTTTTSSGGKAGASRGGGKGTSSRGGARGGRR